MTKVEGKLGSSDQIRTGLGRPAIKRLTGGSVGGRSLPTELRPVNSRGVLVHIIFFKILK